MAQHHSMAQHHIDRIICKKSFTEKTRERIVQQCDLDIVYLHLHFFVSVFNTFSKCSALKKKLVCCRNAMQMWFDMNSVNKTQRFMVGNMSDELCPGRQNSYDSGFSLASSIKPNCPWHAMTYALFCSDKLHFP